eukprot:5224336-Alexandrium_andersonii.AAC.1
MRPQVPEAVNERYGRGTPEGHALESGPNSRPSGRALALLSRKPSADRRRVTHSELNGLAMGIQQVAILKLSSGPSDNQEVVSKGPPNHTRDGLEAPEPRGGKEGHHEHAQRTAL